MKQFLFLFLLLSPLWAYSSCEDEDKLPGSKPEILLGKWENFQRRGSYLPWYILETYEFTPKGGSIKQLEYFPEEDRYEDYHTSYFTDWAYSESEKTIYFLWKKGGYTDRWYKSVSELTPDYFRLDTGGEGDVYSKVNNTN